MGHRTRSARPRRCVGWSVTAVLSVAVDGVAAGNGALASVDLAGSWSFTPAGRAATTITVPAPGGAYALIYVPTGKALDVNGYATTLGLQLQQWTPSGGTNQQRQLVPA